MDNPWSNITARNPPPPTPRAKAKNARGLVVGAIIGAVIGMVVAVAGVELEFDVLAPLPSNGLFLVSFVLLLVAWFVAVGFHELGHLVGGWMIGGRFLLWTTGPLMLRRTPAGIRFGINRSVNQLGGTGACLPLDSKEATPRRLAVMIVAGPAFSLGLALAALPIALELLRSPLSPSGVLLQHFVVFTAALSALAFFASVWPSTEAGFHSDGRRAVGLLRKNAHSDQEAALIALTAAGLSGVPPADYPLDLVRRATALRDGSLFDLYGQFTCYFHAADRCEWREAQTLLDRAVAGLAELPPYLQNRIHCEYAWLLATRTGDVAAARAWLDSRTGVELEPSTRLRAEAAILLAEGDKTAAADKAREARRALDRKSLSPVPNPFEVAAVDELLARAS